MTSIPAPTRVFAPAKINLSLHVLGKRADGYHLLDSLVVFAGVGDSISVQPADDIRLSVTGPFGALLNDAGPENLVMRAARYLAGTTGAANGAAIVLEKNLPVASGIGGGSSDAAATLIGCATLWNENLAQLADADLAANLGADVPVCLRRVPTFMSGIGEDLAPAPPLPQTWIVLVNSGKPLATKAVFAALKGRTSPAMNREMLAGAATAKDLAHVLKLTHNDLMRPAMELMPEIGAVLERIESTPGCLLARMSGSGPTCFGLYESEADATAAAKRLKDGQGAWWVAAAPILGPSGAV